MKRRITLLTLFLALCSCLLLSNTGLVQALAAPDPAGLRYVAQTAPPEGNAPDNNCTPVKNTNDPVGQAQADSTFNPLPKLGLTNGCGADLVEKGLQLFFMLVGAIAVLIITVAGFRYIRAAGNPDAVAKAKDAIIYAAVGLAVALAAQAIVAFVFNYLIKN